jgi:hypothetical protein
MIKLSDTVLVSSTTPLGQYIDYSNAPNERLDYLKQWAPPEISFPNLISVFKRDLFIDSIVERLVNVDLYYIESSLGRGEELYYFACNNRLFHGEKIWSQFHPFLSHLHSISPSAEVHDSAWFVGSKNNYTHQLIDFLPNLIFRYFNTDKYHCHSSINIYGKINSILESAVEFPLIRQMLNSPKLYLGEIGQAVMFGSWQIRCIRFRELFLVRHLSIHAAFSLLQRAINTKGINNSGTNSSRNESMLYLSRSDNRVINQDQVEAFLSHRFAATILKNVHNLDFASKKQVFSSFNCIVLPPGSDNINALCFSDPSARLLQMIPVSVGELLNSPFSSYACLRYLLPFLHRLIFLPAEKSGQHADINSGIWNISSIKTLLEAHS